MSAGAILFRYSDFRVPSLSGSSVLVVYSCAFSLQSLTLILGKKCGVELRIQELLVQQVGGVSHCRTSKEGLPRNVATSVFRSLGRVSLLSKCLVLDTQSCQPKVLVGVIFDSPQPVMQLPHDCSDVYQQ